MELKKLAVQELYVLTELFDYNNVEQMISECTHDIQNGIIDIFVLYDKDVLIGELHVMYESDDENYAIRGRRAYLFAFRVREDFQNKGYGTYLLKTVLAVLKEHGYCEFTVGWKMIIFEQFICTKLWDLMKFYLENKKSIRAMLMNIIYT